MTFALRAVSVRDGRGGTISRAAGGEIERLTPGRSSRRSLPLLSSGFFNGLYIIPILAFLILIHEFGHFFAARKCGVKVEEFGIGIPPRAERL